MLLAPPDGLAALAGANLAADTDPDRATVLVIAELAAIDDADPAATATIVTSQPQHHDPLRPPGDCRHCERRVVRVRGTPSVLWAGAVPGIGRGPLGSFVMTDSRPVNLTPSGPPETILPFEAPEARQRLEQALAAPPEERRAAISTVVAAYPRWSEAWERLGDLGRDPIEQYAAFRVGYHRGLDALRANGWRGSGYVRWEHPSNRGFLRALAGLARTAEGIGENDEAERCQLFLRQLDPSWPPADLDDAR